MTGADSGAINMTANDAPLQFVVHQQRAPNIFHADPYADVEVWLDHFEPVATFNDWDDDRKRKHAYFPLEDSAQTWFENRESTMPSWEEFCQRLLAAYTNSDRKEKAEAALQARNQRRNEIVAMYAEGMARLFRRADSPRTDEKKVRQ